MKRRLKILIIGGGMYVTGKGTDNFGTILPALFASSKYVDIEKILLCTTNVQSSKFANQCFKKINQFHKSNFRFEAFPKIKKNINEYKYIALKHKPDAAIVCVPDHLHYKITSYLIKLKIHCLVVKPLSDKTIHAKKLLELTEKNKVLGRVEFHKRYDEANLIIKNKIKNNELGSLLYAVVEYSQRKIIPTKIFKKWSSKSNVFQYLGVHYVDLIYFLTNFKPLKVFAWGQKEFLKNKNINTWDSIQVIIEWKKPNGKIFVTNHITNWIDSNSSSAMSDQKFSIIGTKGKVVSDQKNRGLQIINDNKNVQDINPYFSSLNKFSKDQEFFFGYGIKSVTEFIKDINSIINYKQNYKNFIIERSSFKESIISTAIIEAVNISLITKKSQIVKF
ncbi:MAG: hypothetical protein CFH15_01312 [Alphaproteobacteria bacterium MarineAlpha5_Bin5]|nr:MAG: hypothetical protein CFH15_01312 [Alphaproteobacteria bacterium MarineAlpha5_Bin5]|tara:strand:+ start:1820 stop:2992 length:1173 start_codon:yes stop_codon:yes gene_type:complete